MKIIHWKKRVTNIGSIKNFSEFLKKHNVLIQIFVNLAMLILSIVAISIAITSYNSSNKQFLKNSRDSDSLFKIQMGNEREINANLEKIQKLATKQLLLIDQQLTISSQALKDQVNSGRPILIITNIELQDRERIISNAFAPIIITRYKNSGKRIAYNVGYRAFIVSKDYECLSSNYKFPESLTDTGPDKEDWVEYKPKFVNVIPFYYCFEINYFDKFTGKKYYQTFVSEYNKMRQIEQFFECEEYKKTKVKEAINKCLQNDKQRLLFDN